MYEMNHRFGEIVKALILQYTSKQCFNYKIILYVINYNQHQSLEQVLIVTSIELYLSPVKSSTKFKYTL